MLLAATLLLFPIPQSADTAKTAVSPSIEISSNCSSKPGNDSSLSRPIPAAPAPKIMTDAEIAAGSESVAATAAGANAPSTAIEPASAALPITAARTISRPRETATQRKLWYALSISGSGAAAFDAWSTRRAISQGYGVEGNPLLRPFSHSGALYAATQVSPLVMDFIGKRMMASRSGLVRKMWWLPQAAGSGVSIAAGVHNVGLVP